VCVSIPLRFRLVSSSPVSNLSIPAEKCSTINCVQHTPASVFSYLEQQNNS
jgi:hypothetical protein